MVSLEPIWAIKQRLVTLVVQCGDGTMTAVPSGTPVHLDMHPSTSGREFLLIGYQVSRNPGVCLHEHQLSQRITLVSAVFRDFAQIVLLHWGSPQGPLGLAELRVQLLQVPPAIVRVALTSQIGQGFLQSSAPLSATGVAAWLAVQAAHAGMLWLDVSTEALALLQVKGEPMSVLKFLSVALRSAFLARVPLLVVHSDLPWGDESEEVIRGFAQAANYFLTEVELRGPGGGDTCLVRGWKVLCMQHAVPIEPWLLGRCACTDEHVERTEVQCLQGLWIYRAIVESMHPPGKWPLNDPNRVVFLNLPEALRRIGIVVPVDPRAFEGEENLSGCNSLVQGPDREHDDSGCEGDSVAPTEGPGPSKRLKLEQEAVELACRDGEVAPAALGCDHPPQEAECVWTLQVQVPKLVVPAVEAARCSGVGLSPYVVPEATPARLLCVMTLEGVVIPAFAPVVEDVQVQVAAFGPKPRDATQGHPVLTCIGLEPAGSISRAMRLELLEKQGPWLADDQVLAALRSLLTLLEEPAVVVPPLVLTQALRVPSLEALQRCLRDGGRLACILSGLYVQGHWVLCAWRLVGSQVQAWASHPMDIHSGPVTEAVAAANSCMARVLEVGPAAFVFSGGPNSHHQPGTCGMMALANLMSFLLDRPVPGLEEALDLASFLLAAHHLEVESGTGPLVQSPLVFGGVLSQSSGSASIPALLEHGLASLLKDKGVPPDVVASRVQQAIQRLGRGPIQKALQSASQWRELKATCAQVQPPFQLVLPSEYQGLIQAKAASGEVAGPRRRGKHAATQKPQAPASPVQPTPEQLGVPEGVFETENRPLKQISLLEVGPQASGVVLVSAQLAEPYLHIEKPVSCQGLGLLVLGDFDPAATTLKHTAVRFRAFFRATDEPILLSALLLQIGDKWVAKAVPQSTVNLDLAPSAVLRVAVYRDEWEGPWHLLVQKPIRALLEVVAPLRTCTRVGCKCDEWHGVAGPGDPPALLEVWARTFVSGTFKVIGPPEAAIFNAFVRVPVSLEGILLQVSGRGGVYFEPRAQDSRAPSSEYQVFWMAKATKQELVVTAQSKDQAVGLARIGSRFGLRCKSEHAEALHAALKPSIPYVNRLSAKLFHTGPWPFGTQRNALTASLKDWGWQVKPLQPVPGQERSGIWWAVQATTEPPSKVLQLRNAEVLIVEVKPAPAKPRPEVQVIATKAVCRSLAVQSAPDQDPLQEDDPWAVALKGRAQAPAAASVSGSEAAKAMEARLQAQIKAQVEEVSRTFSGRVQSLEVGVQKLEVGFTAVSSKVEQQESRLTDAMNQLFERQTQRIEELFAPKRPRVEA